MEKIALNFLITLFFIASIFLAPASAEFKKTKIAVLDFQLQGEGYETADMGKIVAEWLITALVKEGRFDVIERRLLQKVLEEQKFGVSGLADESTAAKLGRILGAKIVITGSVMRFQNIIEANARIIEVESTSIIAAESVKSTSAVKLEDLVIQMAEKIIKDFPLEGYIAQRDEDKVLIDLGRRSGVKVGMQFIVYKEGKVIKHPKTGEILDIERIDTGSIEIKNVKDKTSEAVIIKETLPNAIKTGHLIKSTIELVPQGISEKPERISPDVKDVPADADLLTKLQALELRIEEVKHMRESGNPAWKTKYKGILAELKSIYARHKIAPEVHFTYAKTFYAANDISGAEKALKRAFYYRPQYLQALIFKGDMYYEYAKSLEPGRRHESGFDIIARNAYEKTLNTTQDRELQAMMYYKIGNVYADLAGDRENAKDYWHKAESAAPGSKGAKLANERLRAN